MGAMMIGPLCRAATKLNCLTEEVLDRLLILSKGVWMKTTVWLSEEGVKKKSLSLFVPGLLSPSLSLPLAAQITTDPH